MPISLFRTRRIRRPLSVWSMRSSRRTYKQEKNQLKSWKEISSKAAKLLFAKVIINERIWFLIWSDDANTHKTFSWPINATVYFNDFSVIISGQCQPFLSPLLVDSVDVSGRSRWFWPEGIWGRTLRKCYFPLHHTASSLQYDAYDDLQGAAETNTKWVNVEQHMCSLITKHVQVRIRQRNLEG